MKIKLTQKQEYRKNLTVSCIKGKLTTREAATRIGLNIRTIQKDIQRFKQKGDSAFIHGNTNRKRINQKKEAEKNKIINIFQNTRVEKVNPFQDVTYTYFNLILKNYFNINVSVSFVKKILNSLGYFTPYSHKCKSDSAVHLFRERKEHEGELVQADGTPYDWFSNGHNYCIQGFVDDATGYPVGLYMTLNECLLGYTEAFRNMCAEHGLPMQMYPDKAGVFFVNNCKKKNEKHLTQFGVMMENLGVEMFPAHSPQAKGRIERFWQTIQHRLPTLFKLRGINTIEKANKFLKDEFPAIYRKWFPVKPKSDESYFVKADMNKINSILKATFPGHVDKSGIFLLKGYRFFCPELTDKKILIHLNEKEGLWVTEVNDTKRYSVKLVETDTSGLMPEVMKDLIDRVFLKNAKPKFREVYIDVDDVVLSEIKPKKTA